MAAAAMMLPQLTVAQDSRGRVTSTIIADNLQQLPAQSPKAFNKAMDELSKTGAEGAEMIVASLATATTNRSTVEYAICGMVSYVSAPENAALKGAVKEGMKAGVAKLTSDVDKAFVLTQLQFITEASDVEWLAGLMNNEYLLPHALKALISTTGSEAKIIELMQTKKCPGLAYAAAEKGITEAEPILLGWLKEGLSDEQKDGVYYALGMIGSKASVATLASAAKAADYRMDFVKAEGKSPVCTKAMYNYVKLLNRLVATGDTKTALASAKSLLGATKNSNAKCAALDIIMKVQGKAGLAYVTRALKDADRAYRAEALRDVNAFADAEVYSTIVKTMPKLSGEAQIDIINWLGTNHVEGQIDAVVSYFASADNTTAAAAMKAASKIGGDKALTALVAELGGLRDKQASQALLSFNGNIGEALVAALDGDAATQVNALALIGTRQVKAAAPKVFALLDSSNKTVSKAAKSALAGVVTVNDFDKLCEKLDNASAEEVALWQKAISSAVHNESADSQSSKVAAKLAASKTPERYYVILAQANNDQAIDVLMAAMNGQAKAKAFEALLTINNDKMIDNMLQLAGDASLKSQALVRYCKLINASKSLTGSQKYLKLAEGLAAVDDAASQKQFLSALSKTQQLPALYLAAQYLDSKEPAVATSAAEAVKFIAGKNKAEGGSTIKSALEKAMAIYKENAKKGDADAGYAIDELSKAINELAQGPEFKSFSFGAVKPYSVLVSTTRMKKGAAKKALKEAEVAAAQWSVNGDAATCKPGVAAAVETANKYGNFELYTEWKSEGTAGLGVRGIPAIALGGEQSGTFTGNTVAAQAAPADNAKGRWNSLYVKVADDRATVVVNGKTVSNNVIIENVLDRAAPAPIDGTMILTSDGSEVELRNTYIKELPATPRFELSEQEKKEGFEVLFDGTSLHKWEGNTTNYVPQDGALVVSAQYGGGGNLYTKKEYSNFVYRFEFAFITPGVNNGVGIRTPEGKDAAYYGMEIQVLDHDAPGYSDWLQKYQYHGSVYGIIPAKQVKFPERGTWNTEEIIADGDHIKVTVNGEVIVDGNIREACQGHNEAPDGGKNEYTVDHKNHPGLFNTTGHIGFLGHGSGVKFRNVRIKELPATK